MKEGTIVVNKLKQYDPVCLYTYETASARDVFMEIDSSGIAAGIINTLVATWFDDKHVDNKITIKVQDKEGKSLFITYWDRKLRVGRSVFFFSDPLAPGNEYKTILPNTK
jgi:hypothetical protein